MHQYDLYMLCSEKQGNASYTIEKLEEEEEE